MRVFSIISALSILLLCSCENVDYTCVCKDAAGAAHDRRYEIESSTQKRAVDECGAREAELNRSISSYHCVLE